MCGELFDPPADLFLIGRRKYAPVDIWKCGRRVGADALVAVEEGVRAGDRLEEFDAEQYQVGIIAAKRMHVHRTATAASNAS